MAQARVTDYFSQSKRAGVERSLRSKSRQPGAEQRLEPEPYGSRPQSSRRSAHTPLGDALRDSRGHSEQLRSVQEEFLRVIDEAVCAPDHAEGRTEPLGSDKPAPPASPRTPKRTSAEADFNLCSALFSSATEQHSTAKKRLRVAGTRETSTARSAESERKSARKKLVLHKHEDTEKVTFNPALFTRAASRLAARAHANYSSIV